MIVTDLQDPKTELVAEIIREHSDGPIGRSLVVGCGSGIEAAILARQWGSEVVGIDVVDNFNSTASTAARLQLGDAMALDFEDNSFDFVYSYHALEHIPDPVLALSEMSRVLKKQGSYWIGTPNRSRLFGYIGSADTTLREKWEWNLVDWKARLKGRFRNEYGAHAGFTRAELANLLGGNFSSVNNMSDPYYHKIYNRHSRLLSVIRTLGLSGIAYPSVYFMGKN